MQDLLTLIIWTICLMVGGYDSETGSVMKKKAKQKLTTNISANLTADFRTKEESSNNSLKYLIYLNLF